jgi:ribonuclease-3
VSTASDLEQTAGYSFKDRTLLDTALTHSSLQKKSGDNERMEFLGDRVLGLVVAHMLYELFPEEDEGSLARHHTALVQKAALVRVAECLSLGPYIRLSSGEVKAGGPRKDTILADAVEALIGAIYIDGGFAPAEAFVKNFWRGMLSPAGLPPQDPKTELQEWAQARGLGIPKYKVVSRSGPEHAPVFDIEASVDTLGVQTAKAPSKRAAEKAAAAKLLEKTKEMEK